MAILNPLAILQSEDFGHRAEALRLSKVPILYNGDANATSDSSVRLLTVADSLR